MALRVMTYTGLLYQHLIKTQTEPRLVPGKLPSIFPVVIYNGRAPWNARLNVQELIEPADPDLQALHPKAGFILVDLLRLVDRALPDGNTVSDMIRLQCGPDDDTLLLILGGLVVRLEGPEHAPLRRALTAWIKRAILGRVVPDMDFPYVNELKELEAMLNQEVIPWKERWKQEGFEAGIQQGILEGIEKGRVEGREEGIEKGIEKGVARGLHTGMAGQLRRQLTRRFGPLPKWVEERLDAAEVEQLEHWSDRILDAPTLEAVFDEQ